VEAGVKFLVAILYGACSAVSMFVFITEAAAGRFITATVALLAWLWVLKSILRSGRENV
jgi:hypothetical protein